MSAALRVLVTGASGFIGRRLTAHLLARGAAVSVLGRTPCAIAGVHEILVTELSPDAIRATLAPHRFDAVLHLAAAGIRPGDRDADALMQINSLLPGALAAIAHGCGARAFVMSGSCAEYARPAHAAPLAEDAPLCEDKLYGATKAAGTLLALAQGAQLGLPVAVLRLFNVYGPGEAPHRLLPSLAASLLRAAPVQMSAGTQMRDFVHVDDACAAMLAALDALLAQTMAPGVYNVGTGTAASVADFARAACSALGADPALLQLGALALRPDDLPFVVADPHKLAQACGWHARYALADGVSAALTEYAAASAPAERQA